ncbi:MAG: GNAT family N-acetyltransferase [Candidatus Solibacter sp.]|nr:GNAT family N-acetyltransferase [Candidatus Solibacter sp.]
MRLPDGYTSIEPGRLAAVVTYLEMTEDPGLSAPRMPEGVEIRQVAEPPVEWYRALFRKVGERWLWFSRLTMSDGALASIIQDSRVEVYALRIEGEDCGLMELDSREPPDVELTFLGVAPGITGKGLGGLLLKEGIRRAWRDRPRRFWLHTCTLDHPAALGFYIRHGFSPYARGIEVSPDPRLTGALPREAGPGIPLIEG